MPAKAPARPPADPKASQEAVRWFRDRLIMSDEEFAALEGATHDLAFTIAGVNQLDLVTEVWEAVDRAVANGETLENFQERVGDRLAAAWGKDQPWRVENIFRNQAQRAYGVGRWEQMNAPAVRKARPYRRFSAIIDDRTSEICEPIDDTVLPADNPWWNSHVPPLHHNCRSHLVTLSEEEAKEEGVAEAPPDVESAEGFGKAPELEGPVEPDLSEYPEPLVAEYRGTGS